MLSEPRPPGAGLDLALQDPRAGFVGPYSLYEWTRDRLGYGSSAPSDQGRTRYWPDSQRLETSTGRRP